MKCSLVRNYILYVIISELIYLHSADKYEILYHAIECSIVYKIDEVSNRLVVD